MKKDFFIILISVILAITLSACGESPAKSQEFQTAAQGGESISNEERIVPASPDIAENTKNPLWLQGNGSSFEIQLSTKLVSEMKNTDEKVMYVNFIRADESYKMVLTILCTNGEYSGYISKNETGGVFNGDLVLVRDDFINFRLDSKYYSEFADIASYQVFLSGGDIGVPYPFENCTGGEFTFQTESTSENEKNNGNVDTLQMVGNTYRKPNGDNQSGSTEHDSYSFIGKVYKNEDIDITFKLQLPDANGYPTEIVLNGVTYADDVTFKNETFTLENVTITGADGYEIKANWSAKGLEFSLNISGSEQGWRMYGPAMCSGDYYPQ